MKRLWRPLLFSIAIPTAYALLMRILFGLNPTPREKMAFSIRADPHTIPSTTMDEHVIIGGKYFNVLDGTYRLEQRSDSVYRLHLYSHFTMNTSFNFYASWWAGMIMKDIQNNILRVIQTRCEGKL